MNKKIIVSFFAACIFHVVHSQDNNFSRYELVDEIRVTIYHAGGTEIITTSDIRKGLDGQQRGLRDIVLDELVAIDAVKMHIIITDEEIDRFLASMQKEQGMSREMFMRLFKELGFETYEEGREALRKKQMIDQILEYRVRTSKLLQIEHDEAEAYYNEHPVVEKAAYTLVQAYVPKDKVSKEEFNEAMKDGSIIEKALWTEPFTIAEDELADDRKFLKDAVIGSLVEVEEFEDGYELTRLLAKKEARCVPFAEKEEEILDIMRRERFERVLDEYYNKLLNNAHMRFAHEEDRKLVMGE